MPSAQSRALTREIVLAHERLHLQVTTLLRQVERGALGKPVAPVPAASRAVLRGLLSDARKLLGKAPALNDRQVPDLAALAVQLGQLVTALESFEAAHSDWDNARRCICWSLPDAPLPVSRLRPRDFKGQMPRAEDPRAVADVRRKLTHQLENWVNHAYSRGYKDGEAGLPPRPEEGKRAAVSRPS